MNYTPLTERFKAIEKQLTQIEREDHNLYCISHKQAGDELIVLKPNYLATETIDITTADELKTILENDPLWIKATIADIEVELEQRQQNNEAYKAHRQQVQGEFFVDQWEAMNNACHLQVLDGAPSRVRQQFWNTVLDEGYGEAHGATLADITKQNFDPIPICVRLDGVDDTLAIPMGLSSNHIGIDVLLLDDEDYSPMTHVVLPMDTIVTLERGEWGLTGKLRVKKYGDCDNLTREYFVSYVVPEKDDYTVDVRVHYYHDPYSDDFHPQRQASVNWSSISNNTIGFARRYGKAIEVAAITAQNYEGDNGSLPFVVLTNTE